MVTQLVGTQESLSGQAAWAVQPVGRAMRKKTRWRHPDTSWKRCCAFTAHSATFAVFNHTRPHAPRETTTEASMFGKNSSVGAHVGSEPAAGVQAPSL